MANPVNCMEQLQLFVLTTWEAMLLGDLKKVQLPIEDAVIVWQHLKKLNQRFDCTKIIETNCKIVLFSLV